MTVSPGYTWTSVEARIAGNCETVVAVTVASSLPPWLFPESVAARAASSLAASEASAADANTLAAAAAATTDANNWSEIAETIASKGCSAATLRRTEMSAFAAKRAGEKSASVAADATTAGSFDRVAEESDTKS